MTVFSEAMNVIVRPMKGPKLEGLVEKTRGLAERKYIPPILSYCYDAY